MLNWKSLGLNLFLGLLLAPAWTTVILVIQVGYSDSWAWLPLLAAIHLLPFFIPAILVHNLYLAAYPFRFEVYLPMRGFFPAALFASIPYVTGEPNYGWGAPTSGNLGAVIGALATYCALSKKNIRKTEAEGIWRPKKE